jgi:hypothetical protein
VNGQKKLTPSPLPTTFDDAAIWMRIQSAWWLAKEDVAINKFTSLLQSQLHHQTLSPPNCYRDSDTAWEIIVIMAMYFRRLLRERIEKSPFFGIMMKQPTIQQVSTSFCISNFSIKTPQENLSQLLNIWILSLLKAAGRKILRCSIPFNKLME